MIHPAGCFDYIVALRRGADVLSGRAAPGAPGQQYPGLVGRAPHLTLAAGVVTLRCLESNPLSGANGESRPLANEASFEIGNSVEDVAEDGDTLRVMRAGTGDVGAVLRRGDQLVLALGSFLRGLEGEIVITEDPRLAEEHLRCVRGTLLEPQTTFVWVDAEDTEFESTLRQLKKMSGRKLVIAYRARNRDESTALNHRIFEKSLNMRNWSAVVTLVEADARFRTPDLWLDYVRAQPAERPSDLVVRFAVAGVQVELREGEYEFLSPWHFYVNRIRRFGIPGEWSQLGVAREHPRLTEDSIRESTNRIAQGVRRIDRK